MKQEAEARLAEKQRQKKKIPPWWWLTTCWDQLAEEMKADDPAKCGDNGEVKGCTRHQHARGRERDVI